MIHTTQHTIDRWTAQGRRFVPARPATATHRTRDTSLLLQELSTAHPDAYSHADRAHMRRAHATTPVEQTEEQVARIARVARTPGRYTCTSTS